MIEKNNIIVPDEYDERFFKTILSNTCHDNGKFQLTNISFAMGSKPGENYCSIIYRVRLSFLNKNNESAEVSVIIKNLSLEEQKQTMLKMLNVFEKELIMFGTVIPMLEDMAGKNVKFAPKLLHKLLDPIWTIVSEDMCALGYRNPDRNGGLNELHCRLLIEKIAKFHAMSMILHRKDPKLIEQFDKGVFIREVVEDKLFDELFLGNFKYLISIVESWTGFETICKKLHVIKENFYERCIEHLLPRIDEVRVLNHGDLWLNNLLFRYDDKNNSQPVDVVMVDFQTSFYSSPGIDINYFLSTSAQFDVLKNKRDELISAYYKVLRKTLLDKDYPSSKLPTEEAIRNEVKEKEFYGFVVSTCLFPMNTLEKQDVFENNMDIFVDEEALSQKRKLMYTNKRCTETLKYALKRFDELNVLN